MDGNKFRNWLKLSDKKTLVMGILNVTPDSFSDGGKYFNLEQAINHALYMEDAGADIIDVGGESTRPGSESVSLEEELTRILPVVEGIRKKSNITISVDTYKSKIAKTILSNGADFINDISGMSFDSEMIKIAKEFDAPIVIMHIQGTPQNMQKNPVYTNLVKDIIDYFSVQTQKAIDFGIKPKNIIIDPGIGFGKNLNDNFILLNRLSEFSVLGFPILIGPSRKSFIGKTLNLPPEKRLEGTLAATTVGILNGASMVRVHDVKEVKRAVELTDRILSSGDSG